MMKRWIVGIDVGGTKIAISLGSSRGKIAARRVCSARSGRAVQKSLEDIEFHVKGLLSEKNLKPNQLLGIGFGVPGAVNQEKGIVEKSPNLPSWERYPLRKVLRKKFDVPILIENDANAAALGERYFGGGRGISDFLYITVSTGIGSGIVANGQLLRGASGLAGEIGH